MKADFDMAMSHAIVAEDVESIFRTTEIIHSPGPVGLKDARGQELSCLGTVIFNIQIAERGTNPPEEYTYYSNNSPPPYYFKKNVSMEGTNYMGQHKNPPWTKAGVDFNYEKNTHMLKEFLIPSFKKKWGEKGEDDVTCKELLKCSNLDWKNHDPPTKQTHISWLEFSLFRDAVEITSTFLRNKVNW
jgi:hypothetical protein